MADEAAEALREMALHRGLKLVRSRRRKPGTGDYGKFGLTDASGKKLYGFGEGGLTASPEEIRDYLRIGAANTWQQSASITPGRPPVKSRSRKNTDASPAERNAKPAKLPPTNNRVRTAQTATPAKRLERSGRPMPEQTAPARTPPASTQSDPAPVLTLRAAKPSDAEPLASLLGQLSGVTLSEVDAARYLAALRKVGAGLHVAELGAIVGCIGWSIVPTPHRGPIGRITVLVVEARHRRRGVGSKLLAEAADQLAKKGCTLIEAMSDIELKNAHGFFRTAGFAQKSYRFVRGTEAD